MSQDTNLPIINPTDNFDLQVQEYFANYFKTQPSISDAEYSRAKAFFLDMTDGNEQAAAALTAATIEAAITIDTYINDVIDKFEKEQDLKKVIPLFLNLSRCGSSLLGYVNNITPSPVMNSQLVP
jgi:hypothetical protein